MRAWCPNCKEHVNLIVPQGDMEPLCEVCKKPIPANFQKWEPRPAGDGKPFPKGI